MGAYDNPKIIQPVNYAEIFNRSQQNIVNTFLQYQAGEQKKKEQAGQIIAESQKKVAEFGKEVQEGTEGTLLGSVTNVSQEMTKKFAELERLRIRGELGNAEYAQATAGLYKNIGEMKAYNQGLEAFEKSLKETENLSAYQEESAAVMGVLEAKKNGMLNIMFRDGKLISQVPGPGKTPDGKPIMVPFDPANLAEAKNLMINEKFDAVAEVQAGADSLKALTRKTGGTFTVKTDAGEVSTKQIEEYIDPKYATEEARIEFLETNSKSTISDINSLEAGSYIVDTKLRAGIKLQQDGLFNSMLQESPYSDAVKDKILDQVTNGQFSKNVVVDGESVDISGFAIAYAKRSMATDALRSFGGLQQDVTSRVIDKRTDKGDGSSFSWGSGSKKDDLNAKYIIDGLLGKGTDKSGEGFLNSVLGTKRGGQQIPRIDKNTGKQAVDPETGEPMFTTINKFDKKVEKDDKGNIAHKYITLTLADGSEQTFDFMRKQDIKELANMLAPSFSSGSTNVGNTIKAMDNYLEFLKNERATREEKQTSANTNDQEIDTTYAN